jgi:hypothetical protein
MRGILPLSVVLAVFIFAQISLSQTSEQSPSETRSHKSPIATKKVPNSKPKSDTIQHSRLTVVETTKLTGIDTSLILGNPSCDTDANLYLRNDMDFSSPIHKLNLKGEKKAEFLASSSSDLPHLAPELAHSGEFWVTEHGEVYLEVMVSMTKHDFLVFGSDGTYKSKVDIDTGSLWHAQLFALFPSGEFLITGRKWQKSEQDYAPFTAMFSASGTFLKELTLQDDDQIYKDTTAGDSKFVLHPGNNRAIYQGAISVAEDGNVYLMRWLSPAVVYAISPGGEVLRRFTVNPGDSGFMPSSMRIAGDNIALEFRNKDTHKQLLKVVDLEGKERVTYDWPEFDGKPLWLSLCYLQNPERFVFLDQTTDDVPVLRIAEPR